MLAAVPKHRLYQPTVPCSLNGKSPLILMLADYLNKDKASCFLKIVIITLNVILLVHSCVKNHKNTKKNNRPNHMRFGLFISVLFQMFLHQDGTAHHPGHPFSIYETLSSCCTYSSSQYSAFLMPSFFELKTGSSPCFFWAS